MWRHPRHAPLAFLRQGQPCSWSSHRRQRHGLHVGESQGARQGPPHKLRAAERQIPARSIPHSCEEARSGGKPTPVVPSPLRQKASSEKWVLKGDANTDFFHNSANGRRRKNLICCLEGDQGVLTSQEDIEQHISNFFKSLFGSALQGS